MKNISFILILFLFLLSVNCFSASDKIYSWIDEDGVRHFSDTPTYSVEQESKGIAPFLIDRHGRKQIIQSQKLIEVEVPQKRSANQALVQQIKSKLKSGGGQLNLNVIDLFVSSFLPVVFPFFLLILLFMLLKLTVTFFLKRSKPIENKSPKFMRKKYGSNTDFNSPYTNSSEFNYSAQQN